MKNLAFLLMLFSSTAFANQPFEAQLPMMCGDKDNLLNALKDKYGEEIVFMAPSENQAGQLLTHSLWINPDKHSWTFVVVNRDQNVLCLIASGDNAYQIENIKGESL